MKGHIIHKIADSTILFLRNVRFFKNKVQINSEVYITFCVSNW